VISVERGSTEGLYALDYARVWLSPPPFAGYNFLIIEDEIVLARDVGDMLAMLGDPSFTACRLMICPIIASQQDRARWRLG
jgi:hypothetical protein